MASIEDTSNQQFRGTTAKILCALRAAQIKFNRFESLDVSEMMQTVTQLNPFDKKVIRINQEAASSRANLDAPSNLSVLANNIADAIATLWNKEQTKLQAQGFSSEYDSLAKRLDAVSSNKDTLKKEYGVICDTLKQLHGEQNDSSQELLSEAANSSKRFKEKVESYRKDEATLKEKLLALNNTLTKLVPPKAGSDSPGIEKRPE